MSFEIGYAGTKGNRLLRRMDTNMPSPGPGNVNSRRPIRELDVPGIGLVTPLADTFRREWSANSNYHALILNVKKRFSGGLSFLANYTFSKALADARGGQGSTFNVHPQNVHDLRAEKATASEHIPHRFVASANYELPFGRGRPFLSGAHGAVDAILGGWDIGGIMTMSSGRPFTITRMLAFDSVKLRLEREQPLTFLEFNYMILQAYDFLELAR
ncbi:MAG: hypothetical protein GY953_42555, partial [bacterium]|nr:hypothetical protein [bacterium]